MNTLELGKYWLSRLSQALPDSSTRMKTRMAWRLAALSVTTDEALAELSDSDLTKFVGGSATFLDIRDKYLRRPPPDGLDGAESQQLDGPAPFRRLAPALQAGAAQRF